MSNFMHELVLKFRGGISLLVNKVEASLPQENRTDLSTGQFENTNAPKSDSLVSDFARPHSVHTISEVEVTNIYHFSRFLLPKLDCFMFFTLT